MDVETNSADPPASAGTREAVARAISEASARPDEGGASDVADSREAEGTPAEAPSDGQQAEDVEAADAAPQAAPAPAAPTGPLRAPQSWRGVPKSHWEKLPREVQEEAIRLDIETKKVMQASAEARKETATWRETIAPFESMLKEVNVSPTQAIGELFSLAATLRTGQPQERIQVVGDLIRQFVGTDEASLTALARHLEGGGAAPAPVPQPAQPVPVGVPQEQVDALVQRGVQAALVESDRRAALQDWSAFESTRPEFLEKVRPLLATAAAVIQKQQGRHLTAADFQRAYDQACRLSPEIAPIIAQREAAAAATKTREEAMRKAAAATGIKNEPTGLTGDGARPQTTREEVKRQMTRLSGSRRV